MKQARSKLHTVQHMIKRGAHTDAQMEEYYNFIQVWTLSLCSLPSLLPTHGVAHL